MLRLFDIQGGKVIIHSDTWGIPCFKTIWDENEDKALASNLVSYIVLNNHPDSPYVTSIPTDARRLKLKEELFGKDWEEPATLKAAESAYIEFLDTLILKMLRSLRNQVESVSRSLDSMKGELMDLRSMKDVLDIAGKMEKAVKSITLLEKQVRKEEMESSRVKGGSEIGHFEIPKK